MHNAFRNSRILIVAVMTCDWQLWDGVDASEYRLWVTSVADTEAGFGRMWTAHQLRVVSRRRQPVLRLVLVTTQVSQRSHNHQVGSFLAVSHRLSSPSAGNSLPQTVLIGDFRSAFQSGSKTFLFSQTFAEYWSDLPTAPVELRQCGAVEIRLLLLLLLLCRFLHSVKHIFFHAVAGFSSVYGRIWRKLSRVVSRDAVQ